MNLLDHFRAMARNNAWSNYRLHKACAQLSRVEFTAERVSFFPSLHLTLHHILIVDWYYIDGLEGGGRGYDVLRAPDDFPTLAAIAEAQTANDHRLIAFCDGLNEAGLDRMIELKRKEPVPPDKVGDILAHLFVHQIHHRGQAHAMLSSTKIAPPQLDEFFLAGDGPRNADDLKEIGIARR